MKLKQNLMPFLALPLVMVISLVLWVNLPEEHYASVYSGSGIWDLRDFDFTNATASIHGSVEYIPVPFLAPCEFVARESEISLGFPRIRGEGATVRVRLLVSDDGYYVITRISTGYADRIYLNGEWLRDVGRPGDGAEGLLLSHVFHFKARPENGVIELQNQMSNFIYHVRLYRDGLLEELLYGNAYRRVAYTTNIVLGIFLAMAVVSLLLFLFSRNHSRPALFFALLCIVWFLFTGAMGSRAFVTIAPWYIDSLRIRLAFAVTPVAGSLSILIIRDLFPGLLHRYFLRGVITIAAGWIVYFLFADIETILGYALWICLGFAGVCSVYVIAAFAANFRRLNIPRAIFAIGEVVMIYSALRDILMYVPINIGRHTLLLPPFAGTDFVRIGTVASLFCQFAAVFIATAREMEKTKEQAKGMESYILVMNQQLEMQRGQYAGLIENDKRNKAARHDIRHHLATLGGLADAGSTAEIRDYLADLVGAIGGARDTKYCENLTVNAVVSHYLDMAKDEGYEVSSRFVMPEETGNISAMDLCVVLGNLLENAVEACRRMDGGRFIRANSMVKGTALFITIDNSHSGRITKSGDAFMSSKREGEGIGISSVKAIAQKYEGEARFDAEDGVFKASVMLRIG